MITLALGGWHSHGTVAVASSGQLLAAVEAGPIVGVRHAGLAAVPDPWAVVSRCLGAARVSPDEIACVRLVADGLAVGTMAQSLGEVERLARALALVTGEVSTVDADAATHAFAQRLAPGLPVVYAGGRDGWVSTPEGPVRIARYDELAAAGERLARALGQGRRAPWQALQRLAEGHSADPRWVSAIRPVLRADHGTDVRVSMEALESVLRDAAASVSVPLDAADSPHVGAQAVRAALAAAWLSRVSEVLAEASGHDDPRFGGIVGTMPAVARHRWPDILPCPDARAAVVGAAIEGGDRSPSGPPPRTLTHEGDGRLGEASLPSGPPRVRLQAIGEGFDEADVKLALESSRLDYLYEPRPERLMDRVSALLASGKLVAWFEGRADLDDVPSGTRVVIADAAERYARDNINVYLRHQPVESLLTVAVTEATAARHLGDRAPAPGQRARLVVPAALSSSVEGATSRHGLVDLVVVRETEAPGLHRLLIHHETRTGHPALVVAPLATAEGPVAARPIDAIGVTYTTPVDALVMGRFVIFKDYWLLRSGLPTA